MSGGWLRSGGRRTWNRLQYLHTRPARLSDYRHHTSSSSSSSAAAAVAASKFCSKAYLGGGVSPSTTTIIRRTGAAHLQFTRGVNGSTASSSSWSAGAIRWYLGMIKSHPVMTKSITAALIFTAADLSSQMITHASLDSFDPTRTLRMAGYGLVISGPSLHLWFNFVSKVLPKTDMVSTFKKIVLGQATFGPAITVVFFSVNAALQGENVEEIIARLKRDLAPTLLNGVLYWPICDFITFKFIPVHLQPLTSNSFSYLWTIYLSYMGSREKVKSREETD